MKQVARRLPFSKTIGAIMARRKKSTNPHARFPFEIISLIASFLEDSELRRTKRTCAAFFVVAMARTYEFVYEDYRILWPGDDMPQDLGQLR